MDNKSSSLVVPKMSLSSAFLKSLNGGRTEPKHHSESNEEKAAENEMSAQLHPLYLIHIFSLGMTYFLKKWLSLITVFNPILMRIQHTSFPSSLNSEKFSFS